MAMGRMAVAVAVTRFLELDIAVWKCTKSVKVWTECDLVLGADHAAIEERDACVKSVKSVKSVLVLRADQAAVQDQNATPASVVGQLLVSCWLLVAAVLTGQGQHGVECLDLRV
jgi:hypothetical protein